MIDILLTTALVFILGILWINHRILNYNVKELESSNEYLRRLLSESRKDNNRLVRRAHGDGTYTYEDGYGNKYDDALEVTYNDIFLIIKRRSGSVAIPRDNNKGYTMTKNIVEGEPENAKDS